MGECEALDQGGWNTEQEGAGQVARSNAGGHHADSRYTIHLS